MNAEESTRGSSDTQVAPPNKAKTFASGRYVVRQLLGEGAQKLVYLVNDAALGRDCAFCLLKETLLGPDELARLRHEAQVMASLGAQPHIVTVFDLGEEEGRPYIICEYVAGGDLRAALREAGGRLSLPRSIAIGKDICRGLAVAHERGIVHRDIKPANVWLTEDGSAKLGDFGIALATDTTRLTAAGTVVGTATYMAPELALGSDVDGRSDLYSLGCVLYELVSGRPPFTGDDPMAVISQHVHASPIPPSDHNPEIPRALERLILRLLAKAKDERPSSAEEVLAELEQVRIGLETDTGSRTPAALASESQVQVSVEQKASLTILFTDIEGSTRLTAMLGDALAQDLFRVHNRLVRQQVELHDGREVKTLGDGFMVVFQDTAKAVLCAMDIQRAMEGRNRANPAQELSVRIGINVGEAISEEDDVFGLDVIVASRIASKARGGQILVSQAVRHAADLPGATFVERGWQRLKGVPRRQRLLEVQWRAQPAGERRVMSGEALPFVGRRTELMDLRRHLGATRSGRGSVVLLTGVPGVGKTRLVRELAGLATSLGFGVLAGSCHQAEWNVPYGPFVQCLESYIERTPLDLLRQQIGRYGRGLVDLLPGSREKLTEIAQGATGAPAAGSAPAELLYSSIFAIAESQPLLIVLDNLQWADPGAVALVKKLAGNAPTSSLMIIGTYRDAEAALEPRTAASLKELQRHRAVWRLRVKPFDRAAVRELLTAIGMAEPPRLLSEAIYWQSEGIPSRVEETMRRLAATGALFDENGNWRADVRLSDFGVPGIFSLLVGNRLRALPTPYRRAAARTSAMGNKAFTLPIEGYIFIAIVSGFAYLEARPLFYVVMVFALIGMAFQSFRAVLKGQRTSLVMTQLTYLAGLAGPGRRTPRAVRGVVLLGVAAPFIAWLGWAAIDDCCLGGPAKMGGDVNVLVAAFGDRGQKDEGASPDSRQISVWLADSLQDRFASQLANKAVAIRGVASVIGDEEEALQLGAAHGADLVIYGEMLQRGEGVFITPRYTFTGRGTEELTPVELADLVGESGLGAPLGPIRFEDFDAGSEGISSRSQVVASFTAGLVSLLVGDEATATLFEHTLQLHDELELPESEVLHLFLAKALALEGTAQAYERALPEFRAALEINPDYARPYFGVAGWHYLAGADQRDAESLLNAVDWYAQAIVAPTRPPTPILEAKAHLGKGNAYLVLAQFEDINLAQIAREEYETVIELDSECGGGLGWWDPRSWGPWKSRFESRPDYCPQLLQIADEAKENMAGLDDLEVQFVSSPLTPEANPVGTFTSSRSEIAGVSTPPKESTPTPLPQAPFVVAPGAPNAPSIGPPPPTPTLGSRPIPTPTPALPSSPTATPTPPPNPTPTEELFFPPVVVATVDIGPNAFNFPAGSSPLLFGMAPDGRTAYLSRDYGLGEVAVIDTDPSSPTWNTVTHAINVGFGVQGVTVNPDGGEAWAALCGDLRGVDIIDTQTKEVTEAADNLVGRCLTLVAFTPDGAQGYVTDSIGGNRVWVVDSTTRTASPDPISVGSRPIGIAITPDGSRAYVVNAGSNSVSVIDIYTDQVTETIDVGDLPALVAITPDGSRSYVTNRGSDSVSVIDTDPASPTFNTVIKTVSVGDNPIGVALSPDGLRAYVANRFSNTLSVIDTDPNSPTYHSVFEDVDFGGEEPVGVAVTPDGCFIYVANVASGDVTVFATQLADCPALRPPTTRNAYGADGTPTPAVTPTSTPTPAPELGLIFPWERSGRHLCV